MAKRFMTCKAFVAVFQTGMVVLAGAFMTSCKKGSCTVETPTVAMMTPDKQAAIDLYTKKCHVRGTNDPTKDKEYQVVVLRPVMEPPPQENRYKEEDVVFEVEKGPERIQLSFGNPGTLVYFNYLPEEERKSGLAIECYLSCPEAGIRKQLLSWHGKPIHYFRTEAPNTPPIVQ
jgi:hypothetical protein